MRTKRVGITACLMLAIALVVSCSTANPTSPATGTPDSATGLDIGQKAPAFTVDLVSGQTVTLASLRGKVVLINFWATWCAPCRREMPFFQQLADRYGGKDFQVLAINYQEQSNVITKYTKQIGLKFDIGLDLKGTINHLYGVNQYPVSYVIGRDGTILARQAGPFSPPASLEASLKSWIAGS